MKINCEEVLMAGYLFETKLMDYYYQLYNGELSKLQAQALSIINDCPGIISRDIASALSIPKQYTSKLINHLIELKYAKTEPNPNDGRTQLLYLTPSGKSFLQKHIDLSFEHFSLMISGLSNEEQESLLNAFSTIRNILEKL